MLIAFIIFFVVFVVLSIFAFLGKFNSFIISEKKNDDGADAYDCKAAGRFLGIVMILLALSALMGVLGYLVAKLAWLVICAPIFFIAVLIFALVYVNTENRFLKKKGGKRYRK